LRAALLRRDVDLAKHSYLPWPDQAETRD
jgi:hypothetical protein